MTLQTSLAGTVEQRAPGAATGPAEDRPPDPWTKGPATARERRGRVPRAAVAGLTLDQLVARSGWAEWLLLFVLHDERSRGNLELHDDGVWRITEAGYTRYRGLLEAFDPP